LTKTYRWLYPWYEGWRLHPERMTIAQAKRLDPDLRHVPTTELIGRVKKRKSSNKGKTNVKKSKIRK
jgi:hypothetical protein